MTADRFHDKPFDEGTLTKLEILEGYAKAWLPVFLSQAPSLWREMHIFDFFAGPGQDSAGQPGSPLRLLRQLAAAKTIYRGWPEVRVHLHLFDSSPRKIAVLKGRIAGPCASLGDIGVRVEALGFQQSFPASQPILKRKKAAKLVLIDQYGVSHVSDEIFRTLVDAPACDFLFFISSSTLHRFRDHHAIKPKIKRPDDFFHVHQAACDYYRSLLPTGSKYFLGRFSLRKGTNIYGVIFGSGHPLGMDKFLEVAWRADPVNGEADFDINRDNFGPLSALLPPSKLQVFEADLEARIKQAGVNTEADVIGVCFAHGVRRIHAVPVLKRLKKEGAIDYDFRAPDIRRLRNPRPLHLQDVS